MFRIADRQMAGETVIQPPPGEGPAGADQMPLAVLAQLFRIVRFQLPGKLEPRLLRLVNGYAISEIEHGEPSKCCEPACATARDCRARPWKP